MSMDAIVEKVCLTIYGCVVVAAFMWAVFQKGCNPWWLLFGFFWFPTFASFLRKV